MRVTTVFNRLLALRGITVLDVTFGAGLVTVDVGLRCPTHGVRVEGVPFARAGSRFTADFEDLVAYLATKADKTTITRLQRLDWTPWAGSVNAS